MKIEAQGMFHTPKDFDELFLWIDSHSREDRAHLYTAAMMSWNLAASITSAPDREGEDHVS